MNKELKIYGEEIREKELNKHKQFLVGIREKVKDINEKFQYDPLSDEFKDNKKPH